MGDVIVLAERRRARERAGDPRALGADARGRAAIFFFDLASPLTYLAAERVERLLGTVRWRPVALEAAGRRLLAAGADRLPAVRVGRALICGEDRLAEAAAVLRASGRPGRRVTGLQQV